MDFDLAGTHFEYLLRREPRLRKVLARAESFAIFPGRHGPYCRACVAFDQQGHRPSSEESDRLTFLARDLLGPGGEDPSRAYLLDLDAEG